MTLTIKRRAYDSTVRKEAAEATRQSIIESARRLFLENGYAGTTMPAIAQAAGIALDTVYAAVGKKPTLFRLLVETAISGRDLAVPAEQRDYVRAIRAEPDAAKKLQIYAYDAYFLVCAMQFGTPLLTLDEPMKGAAASLGIEVLEI